ncbi:unnamed protein product [Lactuca saligna]|uniref:F-box associated beta-propeller type 3 domain-containing protein n=1 Tax=Lactuca saligna TaxID=75948 RepID=A0AA36EGA6_LACSI|nr:unnamed protein product [Lactuca saligna]CAI9295059.1 unnamed protein product [Lactuca saligna]
MHTLRSQKKIHFIHLISDDKNEKQQEFFYTSHGEEEELALYLCPKRGYIDITTEVPFPSGAPIGSCNGTFCLWTKKGLILWNPSIRRKLIVPEFPQRSEPFTLRGIGFGFDPISDDYKVVQTSNVKGNNSFVYAVKSGTWCEIASPKHQNQIQSIRYDSFFFNGVLHWVTYINQREKKTGCISCILTFNLSTHVFDMIPVPMSVRIWVTSGLTTMQGSLALISCNDEISESWIRVWRDASWSVVFKLKTDQLFILGVLELHPQALLLNTFSHGLHVYNLKTGVSSRVGDFNAASSLRNFYQCVETLHLLDMGETIAETELHNYYERKKNNNITF